LLEADQAATRTPCCEPVDDLLRGGTRGAGAGYSSLTVVVLESADIDSAGRLVVEPPRRAAGPASRSPPAAAEMSNRSGILSVQSQLLLRDHRAGDVLRLGCAPPLFISEFSFRIVVAGMTRSTPYGLPSQWSSASESIRLFRWSCVISGVKASGRGRRGRRRGCPRRDGRPGSARRANQRNSMAELVTARC